MMFEIVCENVIGYNNENSLFPFSFKVSSTPHGCNEVPYGCNRTPSEEPGVNGSYSTQKVFYKQLFLTVYIVVLWLFLNSSMSSNECMIPKEILLVIYSILGNFKH